MELNAPMRSESLLYALDGHTYYWTSLCRLGNVELRYTIECQDPTLLFCVRPHPPVAPFLLNDEITASANAGGCGNLAQ